MSKRKTSNKQPAENSQMYRYLESDVAIASTGEETESRTIECSFSSTRPYLRYAFWRGDMPEGTTWKFDEVVSSDPADWNLERVDQKVCPFLDNHWGQKLGQVVEVKFDGNMVRCSTKLRRTEEAENYLKDVQDGIPGGISFGYKVGKYELLQKGEFQDLPNGDRKITKPAVLLAKDITLLEVSRADIPADPTVGFDKSGEEAFTFTRSQFTEEALEELTRQDSTVSSQQAEAVVPVALKEQIRELVIAEIKSIHPENNMEEEQKVPNPAIRSDDQNLQVEEKTSEVEFPTETESLRKALRESLAENRILKTSNAGLVEDLNKLKEQVQIIALKDAVTSSYSDLRSQAEKLLEDCKISRQEFLRVFSDDPKEDLQRYLTVDTKQEREQEFFGIQYWLKQVSERSPMLNVEMHSSLLDSVTFEPNSPQEKSREKARSNYTRSRR